MEGLRVTAAEVKALRDEGKPPVILDVREAGVWASSTTEAAGSIRMPLDDFEAHADSLPRDAEIVAYCT